eukprot:Nitzschia sp. Nitz4//scaffold168_size48592//26689//27168//NITZ4_007051-RA/size48592-processed-gene-0.37-mRNA-1//-1//CDS//3329538324//9324//frame0
MPEPNSPLQVRQKAYDLLNRLGGPTESDDKQEWPQSPPQVATPQAYQHNYSSYQQQTAGETSGIRPARLSTDSSVSSHSSGSTFVDTFVVCVSDACRVASSEIFSQQGTMLRSGYQSLKSAVSSAAMPEDVSGSYQTVRMPQRGYGERYRDNAPMEEIH